MIAWEWGQVGPLDPTKSTDEVQREIGGWIAQFLKNNKLDSPVGPDGTVYDIEIGVRLVPTPDEAAL
jgi:hypothetical protein